MIINPTNQRKEEDMEPAVFAAWTNINLSHCIDFVEDIIITYGNLEATVKNWALPGDNEIPLPEPSTEAKLWVVDKIAQFIIDTEGDGTFRKLIYEYLNLEYVEAYEAGAMCITSSISSDNFHEYPAGRGNRTKHDIR